MQAAFDYIQYLIDQGMVLYPLLILEEKKGSTTIPPHVNNQIDLLKPKYTRLKELQKDGLIPADVFDREIRAIEKATLGLYTEISNYEGLTDFFLSLSPSESLNQFLGDLNSKCTQKNIYPYTPVILQAMLEDKSGNMSQYFEAYVEGLTSTLNQQFAAYIQDILIEQQKGTPYEEVDWASSHAMNHAQGFAWLDGSTSIDEKHFLLGIVHSNSSTILVLEHENGFSRMIFSQYVLGHLDLFQEKLD